VKQDKGKPSPDASPKPPKKPRHNIPHPFDWIEERRAYQTAEERALERQEISLELQALATPLGKALNARKPEAFKVNRIAMETVIAKRGRQPGDTVEKVLAEADPLEVAQRILGLEPSPEGKARSDEFAKRLREYLEQRKAHWTAEALQLARDSERTPSPEEEKEARTSAQTESELDQPTKSRTPSGAKKRTQPRADPEVAKRRSLVKSNPDVSAKEMCEIFDRNNVPLPRRWQDAGLSSWVVACRNPNYTRRIRVLISKDRQTA
jgi:hypothetical protein